MATKYIVDNVPNQTISGNVTINGNLSVTGTTGLATYKALLTQWVQSGTDLTYFNNGLIIGETYTILSYQSDDDFSNIADVQTSSITDSGFSYLQESVTLISTTYNGVTGSTNGSGLGASFDIFVDAGISTNVSLETDGDDYSIGDTITILGDAIGGSSPENDIIITVTELNTNTVGCVFIATGETPANWNNYSEIESSGNLLVTVLENNLGFDIEWSGYDQGVYLGFNSTTGPLHNTFNRNTTFVLGGTTQPFWLLLETFTSPISLGAKDDTIIVSVFDTSVPEPVSDNLYYFPVEIQILQDTDTTPIIISGIVLPDFPFPNPSVDLMCGDMFIQSIYGNVSVVNNMSELIIQLNSDPSTTLLGTYSDDGVGGVLLEMPTNLVNQFCSSGTLTFLVFND